MPAENLLGDKAYDTDRIIELAEKSSTNAVIPSKRNRKIQRDIDLEIYQLRHIVENTFQKFKEWRGIATRYCKNTKSFIAALQIRAILLWAKIS
jgi:transposase